MSTSDPQRVDRPCVMHQQRLREITAERVQTGRFAILGWFIALSALHLGLTTAPTLGAEPPPPRLTGILVGPHDREAVFLDAGQGRALVVSEGATLGRYTIRSIAPQTILVDGPSGLERWSLDDDRARPVPPSPAFAKPASVAGGLEAETREAGLAVGLAALGRDRCARAGFLPGTVAEAESKLMRMIRALNNLPPREGVEAEHNAPTAALASALATGLESARRERLGDLDNAACLGFDKRWKRSAGRYGLL